MPTIGAFIQLLPQGLRAAPASLHRRRPCTRSSKASGSARIGEERSISSRSDTLRRALRGTPLRSRRMPSACCSRSPTGRRRSRSACGAKAADERRLHCYSREYNNRALVHDHTRSTSRAGRRHRRARATMTCYLDQPLRRRRRARRSTSFPARKGDGSCMMFIHGGYWRSLDKSDFSFLAPAWWTRAYRWRWSTTTCARGVTMEEIVRQMLRASRWLWLQRRAIRHGRGPALRLRAIRPAGT
mgnify:CR=1 FL=1